MCKLLILSQHDAAKRHDLITSAWAYFSRTGETDGFGACWLTRKGKLGWCKSSTPALIPDLPKWGQGFSGAVNDHDSDGGWLMIHGRKATCGVSLENTHPMLDGGRVALIHNGVVQSDTVHNISTTCDSELLLRAWDSRGHHGLEEVTGYFAFGLMIRRRDGWHVVVARDANARLRVGQMDGGWAWGTTDDALAIADATPLCDHRAMHAACFAPNGECSLVEFKKGQERPTHQRSLDAAWDVASGRHWSRSLISKGGEL